jgi:hypothetical protein
MQVYVVQYKMANQKENEELSKPKRKMSHGCAHCPEREGEFCPHGGDVYNGVKKWCDCTKKPAVTEPIPFPGRRKTPQELIAEARAAKVERAAKAAKENK